MLRTFNSPSDPTPNSKASTDFLKRESEKNLKREAQRLMKVDSVSQRFKPYFGLAFISMLPEDIRNILYHRILLLKAELKRHSYLDWFLFVPKDTFHFTLLDVIERPIPDIEQDEVNCYFDKATQDISVPTGNKFQVDIVEFGRFPSLCLLAKVISPNVPTFVNTIRSNFGKKPIDSEGKFHITIAYFLDRLDSQDKEQCLKEAIDSANHEAFSSQATWEVDNVDMYYFSSMEHYKKIPQTSLV